jgi:hypothetical protein
MMNAAICVQAFNKADTITTTLDSLATAKHANEFDLIIVQDGIQGNKFQDRYQDEHSSTKLAIEAWLSRNKGIFKKDLGRRDAPSANLLFLASDREPFVRPVYDEQLNRVSVLARDLCGDHEVIGIGSTGAPDLAAAQSEAARHFARTGPNSGHI